MVGLCVIVLHRPTQCIQVKRLYKHIKCKVYCVESCRMPNRLNAVLEAGEAERKKSTGLIFPIPNKTNALNLPDDILQNILRAVAEGGAQQACETVQSFCRTVRCDDDMFATVLETLDWPAPTDGVSNREAFANVCRSLTMGLKQLDALDDTQLEKFMDGKDPTDYSFLPLWDAVLTRAGLERRKPRLQCTQENIRDLLFRWYRDDKLKIVADYGPVELWDVSRITDMTRLFVNMHDLNIDLKLWDVSSVESMERMFSFCINFNRDLPWDTRSLRNAHGMFTHCYVFNGNISNWNTSNVTDMSRMFLQAYSFSGDLNNWDVRNVTDFDSIFFSCKAMHRGLVSSWRLQNPLAIPVVAFLPYDDEAGDADDGSAGDADDLYWIPMPF